MREAQSFRQKSKGLCTNTFFRRNRSGMRWGNASDVLEGAQGWHKRGTGWHKGNARGAQGGGGEKVEKESNKNDTLAE